MPTKRYKAVTPGFRGRQTLDYEVVTGGEKPKHLIKRISQKAGRNAKGRLTVRHRGGGNKILYRMVDFKRNKVGVPGVVDSIQYDPNRTAFICLIKYADGDKRYILMPEKIKVGTVVTDGVPEQIKVGNTLRLAEIPAGSYIHNIELTKGKGGQLVRSAGAYAVLLAKHDKYATIKLPSGEARLIHIDCRATIGQIGNTDHRNTVLGKAGASRWRRRRPHVRGSVMNPCDHPHGGGEGRAPIGRSGPMTPWGKPALGYKTRNKKKSSDRYIVRKRK